jgi:hypothetical protein
MKQGDRHENRRIQSGIHREVSQKKRALTTICNDNEEVIASL